MRIGILLLLLTSFTGFSQTPGTYGEIYDFDIGDEFRWRVGDFNYQTSKGYYGTINTIYTDKFFSSSGDTLYYVRKIHSSITDSGRTTVTNKIDTILFKNLDSIIKAPDTSYIDTVYNDSMKFNGRTVYHHEFTGFDMVYKYSYIAGCGMEYYVYPYNDYEYYKYLKYYKKGLEEWGDKYVGISTNTSGQNEILIYPNPATNTVYIDFLRMTDVERLIIQDLKGRTMLERKVNHTAVVDLDVSHLSSGIYILRSISMSGIKEKRIVISK